MSKSVRLRASAASTGSKKNTPITSSAGATNAHAAPRRASLQLPARQHPAPLLEDAIGAPVELCSRLIDRHAATLHHLLGDELHLGGDALPFGHLGVGLTRSSCSRNARA